jgi:hypothetical protein
MSCVLRDRQRRRQEYLPAEPHQLGAGKVAKKESLA